MMVSTTRTPASRLIRTSTAVHRAMRNDTARLAALLRDLEARNCLPSARLSDAFAETVALIDHHHRTEDDLVFPFVGKRVSSFSHSIEMLEEDHVDLDAAFARVVSRLRLVSVDASGSRWASRSERLMQEIDRSTAILCAHLDREEDILFPALESLDEDEAQHLLTSVIRIDGIRAVARLLPWIISNADGIERRELRNSLSRRLIVMHDVAWGPRFTRRMRPLYALNGQD
jgi:iron-sulfur cluster repair protein YtfE (RIC family)